MISLVEINALTDRFKVPAETIEKDYAICWLLACFAKSSLRKNFIFYGGTAIKRMYFEDHRFSEDIDFICPVRFASTDLGSHLESSFWYARWKTNFVFSIDSKQILSDGTRSQLMVRYDGYDEIVGSPKEIRVDFSMGIEPYGEAQERKLIETYSDLKSGKILLRTQTLDSILASKLGLLLQPSRREPRDVFDVWFLLNKASPLSFKPHQILKFFKEKYGFNFSRNLLIPHLENKLYREKWSMRLKRQIEDLPSLDLVTRQIRSNLEKLFRTV